MVLKVLADNGVTSNAFRPHGKQVIAVTAHPNAELNGRLCARLAKHTIVRGKFGSCFE